MRMISITADNFESEYIPCVDLDNPVNDELFSYNEEWLRQQFNDGLKIRKYDIPSYSFIEYLPANKSWKPILAPGYTLIQHLYSEGSDEDEWLKTRLVQACETDSIHKNGVVTVTDNTSSNRDLEFFKNLGYLIYDEVPGFSLLVKKFKMDVPSPVFYESVESDNQAQLFHGICISYADQSSFMNYYIQNMREDFEDLGFLVRMKKLESPKQARESGSPLGTFGVFLNGHFLTHQLLNRYKLEELVGSLDLNDLYPEVKHLIEDYEGGEIMEMIH